MKKNLFTLLFAAVLISSCSSDDGGGSVDASIVGAWDIVELNFGESVDWDGDGTSSDNLLDEIECFAGAVTFTAEGEYSSATTEINFEATETEFTYTCGGPVTASGTYSVDGNTLTATDAEDGGTGESTYSISGDTLTVVGPVQIVDVEAVDGEATVVLVRR